MTKLDQLRLLAVERRQMVIEGFRQPEDFPGPEQRYDFGEFIAPYTKGAQNTESSIMLVLQDWSSAEKLRSQGYDEAVARLGRDPSLRTNRRLAWLLRETCDRELADIYATNV
jgi:hypothetical protein